MIEIVFNNLNQNSLKNAQKYGEGEYPGGYSFITYYNEDGSLMTESEAKEAEKKAEAEEAKRWAEATPLGGKADDVFDLSMSLNIGDISSWENLDKRVDSFADFQYDQENYEIKENERRNHEYVLEDLNTIISRVCSGEPARIWYGEGVGEILGFQWLMWNFKNTNIPIEKLVVIHSKSLLNIKPGDWYKYVDLAVPVTPEMMSIAIEQWEYHMKENAKLRAMEDGVVKGVDESYYDNLILKEAKLLSEKYGEFQENWLIGSLSDSKPELPYYWFYTRIEQLILSGTFEVTKPSDDGWPKSWKFLKLM